MEEVKKEYSTKKDVLLYGALLMWSAAQLLRRTWFAGTLNTIASIDTIRLICLVLIVLYEIIYGRKDKQSLIGLFVAFVLAALALNANHKIILDSIWFIYVSRDVPFRKLARFSFLIISVLGSLVIISSLIGIIPNMLYEQDARPDRYALGFAHPNTGPMFFTFAFLSWAYQRDKKFGIIDALVILGMNIFLYIFTNSRTAAILTFLLVILMLVFKYIPQRRIDSTCLKLIISCIVIIVCAISIGLSAAYNSDAEWMEAMDRLVSGRLHYSHMAIKEYGFSMFGQRIPFGSASNYDLITGQWVERQGELLLDNMYVKIPINCGVLFLMISLAITAITNWRLLVAEQYRLLALITISALYGMMENSSSYLFYNSFLFLMAIPFVKYEDLHSKLCASNELIE